MDIGSSDSTEALTVRAPVLELKDEQQNMVGTGLGGGSTVRVQEHVLKDNRHVLARDGG